MSSDNHFLPFSLYVKVLVTLLCLTVLTVLVAKPVSGFDLGAMNTFIAILIASVKAGFVLAFFMHLKYETKFYISIILLSVFFLILFFGISYIDIITRVPETSTL